MITTTQLKKVGFILTITTILILGTFLASAAIRDEAKRTGYFDYLYLGAIRTYDDNINPIIVENDLELNSNSNLILSGGSIQLNTNPGTGNTPASYIYQGAFGSTSKQYAFAIHDSLWITRHAFIDRDIDVGGDMDSKGTISTEERLRIKNSDDSSKASIEWVDHYGGDSTYPPALLIKSGFESSSSIAFQPGGDWNSRMVLDKDGNLNVKGEVNVDDAVRANRFVATEGLSDTIDLENPSGDDCEVVVEHGIITSFTCTEYVCEPLTTDDCGIERAECGYIDDGCGGRVYCGGAPACNTCEDNRIVPQPDGMRLEGGLTPIRDNDDNLVAPQICQDGVLKTCDDLSSGEVCDTYEGCCNYLRGCNDPLVYPSGCESKCAGTCTSCAVWNDGSYTYCRAN